MERFNHKRLEMESDSVNALTKDSCLDMSEPPLLDDNHYRADIRVSLVGLRTKDKPFQKPSALIIDRIESQPWA
jgi:hypothetical protein